VDFSFAQLRWSEGDLLLSVDRAADQLRGSPTAG